MPVVGEAKIVGMMASVALTPDKASRAAFAADVLSARGDDLATMLENMAKVGPERARQVMGALQGTGAAMAGNAPVPRQTAQ